MTDEDRLSAALAELESVAPSDVPPSPFPIRPMAPLRLAPAAGAAVLAAVLAIVLVPSWIAQPGRSGLPSASGTTNATADTSSTHGPSQPPVLAWHVAPFDEAGATLTGITEVEGRLILAGGLLDHAQTWISDDGGSTWLRSGWGPDELVEVPRGMLTQVAGTANHLVALGTRPISGADADVRTIVAVSADNGARWQMVPDAAVPPGVTDVVWNGSRFLAFSGRTSPLAVDYVSGSIGVWASPDGLAWEKVAGPGPFGVSVALIGVAQADGLTGLAVAGASGPPTPELWLSNDGISWERSDRRSGILVQPEALGSSGDELVVVDAHYSPDGGALRNLMRSRDGQTWAAQPLTLEHRPPLDSSLIYSITPGTPGSLLTGYTYAVRGGAGALYWYLAADGDEARLLNVGVLDAVAVGDGFVGINTCGPLADCAVALVFGLPADSDPPQPTIDENRPSTTDDPPSVIGHLSGTPEFGALCIWLTDANGDRWEIIWPDGYADAFQGNEPVLLQDGEVVAEAGDIISVAGTTSTRFGTFCMVGTPYEADAVLDITRRN